VIAGRLPIVYESAVTIFDAAVDPAELFAIIETVWLPDESPRISKVFPDKFVMTW